MTAIPSPRAFIDSDDPPGKRAILGASLTLFVRDGVAATSIRDIARAGGYTNPALFRHFVSKDALASYLFERIFRRMRTLLPPVDDAPFAVQLRRTLAAYLAFMDEDLEAALYFQENLRRFWLEVPPAQRRRSPVAQMRRLLAVGIAQRAVDRRRDQTLLVAALLGLLGQMARFFYFREIDGRPSDWLDRVQALALRITAGER
jgi:TetR/AcrR family transcriptional regulator, repressor of fatR-cypB operon